MAPNILGKGSPPLNILNKGNSINPPKLLLGNKNAPPPLLISNTPQNQGKQKKILKTQMKNLMWNVIQV